MYSDELASPQLSPMNLFPASLSLFCGLHDWRSVIDSIIIIFLEIKQKNYKLEFQKGVY